MLQDNDSNRDLDQLTQTEFHFSAEFNDHSPEITSIIASHSQISFDVNSIYMLLIFMIKQEVERVDEHQYNYHKRTIFVNQKSVSVIYTCSLSLGVENRDKIIKTESNIAQRLTSISISILLIAKNVLIFYF